MQDYIRLTEKSVADALRLPLKRKEGTTATTSDTVINFASYRTSSARIIDEIDHLQSKMTADMVAQMQKQMDKILKNSLFGSMKGSSFITQIADPRYTADMLKIETGDLLWRVKIRCPNWADTGFTFPSESHACEDFARRVVKPWVTDNCAHQTRHMNFAVFAFEDETDATLCYMRFK